MARLWQQIIKGEKGQALLVVLGLLVVGGLLIAPCLSYASTSLNAGLIIEKQVRGVYAADAGVENTLWWLKNRTLSPPPERQLLENVNQMQVDVETDNRGTFSLYYGELVEPELHSDYLSVETEMVWDEEAEAYEYTITVTWQAPIGEPPIKLDEIGVRLPVGYEYELGSAVIFSEDNVSPDEPDDTLDGAGAHMLNWELLPPRPEISLSEPTATQTFYVTGEGDQEGDYAWVAAIRQDVGGVGDIIGTFYRITATATRPGDGEITRVIADVIEYEGTGEISIIFWQATPR